MSEASQFKELVDESETILITSHISPDPDAVSSLLLAGTTLKANYPDKQVVMTLEEKTDGLESLYGYSDIKLEPLDEAVEKFKPDLIILVDGQRNLDRFTRHGSGPVRQYLNQKKAKLAVIDHHEPVGEDQAAVFINDGYIACAQQVYKTLFEDLKLNKPTGYAETTLLGVYSDSGSFIYEDGHHKETLDLVSSLLDTGVSLEQIANKLNSYTDEHLLVLAELMKNTSGGSDYSYTFLSDDFVKDWLAAGHDDEVLRSACGHFANDYLRNIDHRLWGFIVRPDFMEGKGQFAVSFRSVSGVKNVAELAEQLGGGGHKSSAGVKGLKAGKVQVIIDQIRLAIDGAA